MRPDLFAGPAQRDDSHRILARLANGGAMPPAARQWGGLETLQRARIAAVIALLAGIAAAWAWLQDAGAPAQPRQPTPLQAVAHIPAESPAQPPHAANDYPSAQAATIVNEPAHPTPAIAQAPAVAAARPEPRLVRPRPAKPAAPIRAQRNEAPPDGDEDVTLLAAMLKRANPQKPAPTLPKN